MTYVPAMYLDAPDDDASRSWDFSRPLVEYAPWKPPRPHQWDAFTFEGARVKPDEPPMARINLLGGWGSGKTHGAARVALKAALRNPWTPAYGEDNNPTGIIVAPTFRILKQSTMQQFDQLCPRNLIKRRRGPPHNDILMANGFRWVLYSGEAQIEGLTLCAAWVDEIQHPVFSGGSNRFLNLMARIRDMNAATLFAITSGLPEAGFVRDTFGHQAPDMRTILCATTDNPYIPQVTLQAFYDACPSGQEKTLLGGEWMSPPGMIYPQYDANTHIPGMEGNPDVPTHLSFDVGNYGAVLFGQDIQVKTRNVIGRTQADKGLLIVDQLLTTNESVDRQCYLAKTQTKWQVVPGRSVITVDPTTRRDETLAIRKHFPGVMVVKRERGHENFPIETGVRQVQRGLKDALGNVRLYFSPVLRGQPLGILDGIQRYRRNETTGEPVKDNLRDHVLDALRYMVCECIPADKPQARVL